MRGLCGIYKLVMEIRWNIKSKKAKVKGNI